jgi:hypothetical protein
MHVCNEKAIRLLEKLLLKLKWTVKKGACELQIRVGLIWFKKGSKDATVREDSVLVRGGGGMCRPSEPVSATQGGPCPVEFAL